MILRPGTAVDSGGGAVIFFNLIEQSINQSSCEKAGQPVQIMSDNVWSYFARLGVQGTVTTAYTSLVDLRRLNPDSSFQFDPDPNSTKLAKKFRFTLVRKN